MWLNYVAVLSKLVLLAIYYLATSACCGSLGSGEHSRLCSEIRVDFRVRTGDQASLRISRQIAPDAEDTFGWYTFVMNFIFTG